MSKLDAIIHIGFNKCGSSAIQAWLNEATADLKAQGVFYLRTDPRPEWICTNPHLVVLAHTLAGNLVPHRPINALLGIPRNDMNAQISVAEDYQRRLDALIDRDGAKAFVASSESLVQTNFKQEQIQALHEFLTEKFRSVKYVAYIRNPAAWMVSLHGHEGRAKRNADDLEAFVANRGNVPYGHRLRRWIEVVGKDALDVRLFHEPWVSGPGLIADFASLLAANVALVDKKFRPINRTYKRRHGLFRNAIDYKKPRRPTLSASASELLLRRAAPDLEWIEQTFFVNRHEEFQNWKSEDC
ncbi:MAG: hypothetical protein KUG70_11355 [Rhodobacteraceae bacterium]|nr:hypothetical protein [Paracoccaceae bacterium]